MPSDRQRPGAFEYSRDRYLWRIGRAPKQITKQGKPVDSPFYDSAIFVVHGIGEQKDTETAAAMRWGIEDALGLVELTDLNPKTDDWTLPAPYINDGHWAEYADLTTFEDDIGPDLEQLTARQLQFFTEAWQSRTRGWFRSWFWMVTQGAKLVIHGSWSKKLFYVLVTIVIGSLMLLAAFWPTTRKFLVTYANDARLYMEPKGDIEHEIVNLIDRRVLRGFLSTIGLTPDFEALEPYQGALIGGKQRAFKKVTWVAHSLGTVISFNVIGDILHKCRDIRQAQGGDLADPCPKVEPVEQALHRFITLGSPLDKICFLYQANKRDKSSCNSVLRRWPEEYLPDGDLDLRKLAGCLPCDTRQDSWWTNIFYGSDPISGPLDTIERFLDIDKKTPLIQNVSTLGLRIPVASHTAYWADTDAVSKVIAQTFQGYTKSVWYGFIRAEQTYNPRVLFHRAWPERLHGALSAFGLFWMLIALIALIVAGWIHRATIWPIIKDFL